jgi:hypothetical protein
VTALRQVVAVAFAYARALALDPLSFVSVATLAVMLAILWRLSPEPPRLSPPRVASIRLVAVTVMVAVPWLIHGFDLAANGRGGLPPDEQAGRPQAGGWAGAVALALLIVLLGLLAATKTTGWACRRSAPRPRRSSSASSRSSTRMRPAAPVRSGARSRSAGA